MYIDTSSTLDLNTTVITEDIDVVSNIKLECGDINCLDLQGHVITVNDGASITVTGGAINIINGIIRCKGSGFIQCVGSSTDVTLGEGISIHIDNAPIHVDKRSKLTVAGAIIASEGNSAIRVTGYSLAKDNSELNLVSGDVSSSESPIVAEKGGSLILNENCKLTGGQYLVLVDGARTNATIPEDISVKVVNGAQVNVVPSSNAPASESAPTSTVESSTDIDKKDPVADNEDEPNVENANIEEHLKSESDTIESEPEAPAEVEVSEQPVAKVLTKPTYVYGSPANTHYIATITGPVQIIATVNGYYKITFKMYGNNRRYIGFIKGDK